MLARVVLLVLTATACGRFGFDSVPAGTSGDATGDGVSEATSGDAARDGVPGDSGGDGPAADTAVHFSLADGDYLSANNMTGTNSPFGLASLWFRPTSGDSTAMDLAASFTVVTSGLLRNASNHIVLNLQGCTANTLVDVQSVGTYTTASGWVHVLTSWDLTAGKVDLYVNDVSDTNNATPMSGSVCFSTAAHSGIGGVTSPSFDGDMVETYLAIGTYLDLSVVANRRLFRDAAGKPVDLGTNCTTPTGAQPFQCLFGPAAAWMTNQGTGGQYTLHGNGLAPMAGP